MPYLGKTLPIVKDPFPICRDHYDRFGPLSRVNFGNQKGLLMLGPDLAQMVYTDKDSNFSSRMGLSRMEPFLGGSIIALDFEEHRLNRRLMQTAFKSKALRGYVEKVGESVSDYIDTFAEHRDFQKIYPHIKQMMLDIAMRVFLGIDESPDNVKKMLAIFNNYVDSFTFIVPWDLPGTALHRGKQAKLDIEAYVRKLIPQRREGEGTDILSYFCREKDENGEFFSEDIIALNFCLLLFGAHDTTASAITNTLYYLATNSQWQDRLKQQALGNIAYEDLDEVEDFNNIFDEVQRLKSSVPFFPRRTIRPCVINGYDVPAHTMIYLIAAFDHQMEEYWSNPHAFDPDRFSRGEHKQHPFLYRPFGGGAHKCIGMHFAKLVYKCFFHSLLSKYSVSVPENYKPSWIAIPMPKPTDDLPLIFIED